MILFQRCRDVRGFSLATAVCEDVRKFKEPKIGWRRKRLLKSEQIGRAPFSHNTAAPLFSEK
jgi:hypothetical protein